MKSARHEERKSEDESMTDECSYSTLYKDIDANDDHFLEKVYKWEEDQFYQIMGYSLPQEDPIDKLQDFLSKTLPVKSKMSYPLNKHDSGFDTPLDTMKKPMKLQRVVIFEYAENG